jgi:hypothetical protein
MKPFRVAKRISSFIIILGCSVTLIGSAQTSVNVRAWGSENLFGQCNVPSDLTNAVAIAAGGDHSLALRSDGTVVAWGQSAHGQCNVPSGLSNVVAIAAGAYHSVALKSDLTVVSWGLMQAGLPQITNAVAISAWTETLAVLADGTAIAQGRSGYLNTPYQLTLPNFTNLIALEASFSRHRVGLRADAGIVASGFVDCDEPSQCTVPVAWTNIVAISGGAAFYLALKTDGIVGYWSQGGGAPPPAGLSNIVQIAAGSDGGVALNASGKVVMWSTGSDTNVPVDLPFVHAISAGGNDGGTHVLTLVNPSRATTAPIIADQPKSQTTSAGSSVYLVVRAIGVPPLSYQWYLGSNAVSGATNSVLRLHQVQPSQSGDYSVIVSNSAGETKSSAATLNIVPALNIFLTPTVGVTGQVGARYRLDYINAVGPTNAWNALATMTITNLPQYYFDLSARGQPARFYRLVEVP